MTQQMTSKAIEIREQMLKEWAERFGSAKVAKWADDPIKRGLINAVAQIEANEK